MRQYKKPLKYYLGIFALLSIIVLGYSIYLIATTEAQVADLLVLWTIPVFFALIYYGGDTLIQKIADRKKKVDYEGIFLKEVADKMSATKSFLIEDYRRLQHHERFQEAMKAVYKVLQDGNDESGNLDRLEKKFRSGSVEERALGIAIDLVREKNNAKASQPEEK
ncbi:MAG: hypothetical protein PHP32_00515 [Candidatus Izemoplasmatales bacterium]|nr:hypothetical protein [Candidatus Izemoplasmatales bacterium]